MLHWMDDAFRLGAECHIHNIGVAWMDDLSWVEAVEVQRVLKGLRSCSVHGGISAFCMRLWPAGLTPKITLYPERNLPADDSLVSLLPSTGRFLGLSVTGQELMRRALLANPTRINTKL